MMVNRTCYPYGHDRWAANRGIAQSIQPKKEKKKRWTDRGLRSDITIKSYDLLLNFWT